MSSTPGAGTPIRLPLKSESPAHNANGALSVAPRPVTRGMRLPAASIAIAWMSSATCCRNAAAAQKSGLGAIARDEKRPGKPVRKCLDGMG